MFLSLSISKVLTILTSLLFFFQDSDIDKMEKAEILEKTLEVLTRFRREYSTANFSTCGSSTSGLHSSPSARQVMAVRYASGFSSCAEESIRYIQSSRLVPAEVKAQLQNHLRSIARRMETRVVDVAAVPVASPTQAQFPHQYPVHPYSTPTSALYPRGAPAPRPGGADHVSSSVPSDAEAVSSFRIPSPIHTSTPVAAHLYQHDQENILTTKPVVSASNVPSSFQASRRYECITPEIDVVAEADDSRGALSQTQTSSSEHHHQLPLTPELSRPLSVEHSTSPKCYASPTSTPVHSLQQQVFSTSSTFSHHKKGFLPPPNSAPLQAVLSQSHQANNTLSPHLAFSSAASPSSSQTIYTYHGYEPLPATSVSTEIPVRQCFHPLSTSASNTPSGTGLVRSSTVVKPQGTPAPPALDLCVKTRGSHQISPETMWRPW